ncbi:hypothetical protein ACJJTC_002113 [Scirpophaga incertulas]
MNQNTAISVTKHGSGKISNGNTATHSVQRKRRSRVVVKQLKMDERQAAQIEAWLNEVDDDNEGYQAQSSSDEETDYLEEQNHESESEQEQDIINEGSHENSDDDEEPPQRRRRTEFLHWN